MRRFGSLLALIGMVFWLQAAPAEASGGGEKKTEEKSDGHGGGAGGGGGITTHDGSKGSRVDGAYITIAPIIVTVFGDQGVAGRLSAVFTLELVDEAAAASAAARHSKLRDALIHELHKMSEREASAGKEYSVEQIRRRVKKVVVKQLGPDAVLDVLIKALTRG